jgi:hypothetical protein
MPFGTAAIPRKSKEWRDRAEEYRAYAEEARTPEGQSSYLAVAASCDQIADRLERLENTGKPP